MGHFCKLKKPQSTLGRVGGGRLVPVRFREPQSKFSPDSILDDQDPLYFTFLALIVAPFPNFYFCQKYSRLIKDPDFSNSIGQASLS